eukprot:TRINITY_DN4582_c0_g1_i1.p1 TRINITY_DN4582_c0_g1~~TRINITY_DN4582_c0_g1_i1.p1  ORF type:complete len:294 (+),score=35.10 TRINITY_DN4582_c0_g1_i1:587-1468(+)
MLILSSTVSITNMSSNPMMGDISISAERSRVKPTNKQKCLVFAGRGISRQERHFLMDLRTLMPHSKEESKLDEKKRLSEAIPELCHLKGCNTTVFLENRKRKDLYMWLSQVPEGPSVKFLVSNLHTMDELKMTGNCLKGSRPILSFDNAFSQLPELSVLRSLLTQVFGTPKNHAKSKPFIDHVFSFFYVKGRIAFRNYQIVEEKDPQTKKINRSLLEIGPRFTLQPIRILNGSFEGKTVWKNEEFVSPNQLRAQVRAKASRYVEKKRAIRKRQVFVDGKGSAPKPTAVQNVFK